MDAAQQKIVVWFYREQFFRSLSSEGENCVIVASTSGQILVDTDWEKKKYLSEESSECCEE